MTLLSAAIADRYRIERELGQGGMATVYLAHDIRHDRDVAIKVLHADLGAALGSERFLSEIKTTAKLQHPHILPLLDSGEAAGLLYYVMPYVDGETLRAHLERVRQLPIEEAVRIAREVGDALDAAHAMGIVHRDIKPENILLRGGHAVVADFGIALAVQSAGGARMTQTGLSLGTPQYMSPEQAMGERQIDARADIYALGAITYEMLTGDPPFTGSSVQSIVAKVLTERPTPPSVLRDTVPPHVEHAVLTALAKLPADRQPTVAAFVASLSGGASPGATFSAISSPQAATPRTKRWLRAMIAANVVLAAIVVWALLSRAPEPPPSRQQVVLWRGSVPDPLVAGAPFVATQAAIAPDGSSLVYTDSANGWTLMRKRRESGVAEVLAGTQGGVSPFFSPDGKWIGFATLDGKVKKVRVAGGSPITIAEGAPTDYRYATWLDDGTIVYSSQDLMRVSAAGGERPRKLRAPRGLLPGILTMSPLPGSKGFLFAECIGNCAFGSDAYVYDFAADSARLLVPNASGIWYSSTGHVLYTSRDGGLFAAGFDPKGMKLTSEPLPIIDGVKGASVVLSASGSLLYQLDAAATSPSDLAWVDRQGRTTLVDTMWRARFDYPALSPDGRNLAVSVTERTTDLWIRREDGSRVKVNAPGTANWRPAWLPDGRSLSFISVGETVKDASDVSVFRVSADASVPATQVFRHSQPVYEAEISPDSQWIVFRADEVKGGGNIYARRLHGDTALVPLAATTSNEMQATLSPNGRWLAYTSEQQGVREVFVMSFPDGHTRLLVSRGGGTEPRWAHSGRELFFENGGRLMSAAVGAGSTLAASEPKPLFSLAGFRRARNRPQYDVAAGDRRFLMIKDAAAPPIPPVVLVEHWFPELRARLKQ